MEVIRALYMEVLRRPADPEGLRVYTELLLRTSAAHVADVLRASEEYSMFHNTTFDVSTEILNIPLIRSDLCTYRTVGLVVSMYDEDVTWITRCAMDAVVYNKGPPRPGTISVPNQGREGGTYLNHILRYYDTLHDYTIFTQGDPFAHNPDFVRDIHEQMAAFQPLSTWWTPDVPPKNVRDMCPVPHIHIGNHDFVCYHPTFWKDEGCATIMKRIKARHAIDNVLRWTCERLHIDVPLTGIPISMCGMFGVHTSRIHWYPRSFYENMLAFLLEHPDHGYIIERLWATLFCLGKAREREGTP